MKTNINKVESIQRRAAGNRWYFDEMVGNAVHHDEFG
jgi:hypothetical protein